MDKKRFKRWLEGDNAKATQKMIDDCIKRIERIEQVHGNIGRPASSIEDGLNSPVNLYSPWGRGEKGNNALRKAYENYTRFLIDRKP